MLDVEYYRQMAGLLSVYEVLLPTVKSAVEYLYDLGQRDKRIDPALIEDAIAVTIQVLSVNSLHAGEAEFCEQVLQFVRQNVINMNQEREEDYDAEAVTYSDMAHMFPTYYPEMVSRYWPAPVEPMGTLASLIADLTANISYTFQITP